ncbi:MAG: NUDIX hydrolase [Anaerolineae bacterium]|nr:NUDIX hydrolase [Anaerolineae bacterium]
MNEAEFFANLPKKRMAAAALMLSERGEVLIVKPTYRDDWLVPGGTVEAGESPYAACQREVAEEIGLDRPLGRLLCLEYRPAEGTITEALQFLFDGGTISAAEARAIMLPPGELAVWRFAPLTEAMALLNPKLGRRIAFALRAREHGETLYLEDGRPVP